MSIAPPLPNPVAGRGALQALLRERSLLAALEILHTHLGDVFQLALPGFRPVVVAGPAANRFVLTQAHKGLCWRSEHDPVTRLLRHGLLVEDGPCHDQVRQILRSSFRRDTLEGYIPCMWHWTEQVCAGWGDTHPLDLAAEMRRVTLLILMDSLFGVDFSPHIDRLWPAILRTLAYISPGLWLVWRHMPRPGYTLALHQIDEYLYGMITARRLRPARGDDLLADLIATPGMDDMLIRDQLLTLLIAGHDTCTALLAWTLYLLGRHPEAMRRAHAEVDRVLGDHAPTMEHVERLQYLGQVIDEALRLYPPIHMGNRSVTADLEFGDYRIPAGTRLMYSIYLTHRHAWPDGARFDPDRFRPGARSTRPAYTFVPFGAGPRTCIGAAFALLEAKIVLAYVLQRFDLTLVLDHIHPHMGATLEPRPGVIMRARRRR